MHSSQDLGGVGKFVHKKRKVEDLTVPTKSNQSHADVLLAKWIAKSLRPFSIVEDEGFQEYLHYVIALNQRLEIPSRKKIL